MRFADLIELGVVEDKLYIHVTVHRNRFLFK